MKNIDIKIKLLDPGAQMPIKQHDSDAGYDICSLDECIISPKEILKVKTGISLQLPNGYAGLVLPRSGLASKYGVSLINSPGLIDSGYRGELKVPLINHLNEEYKINKDERIAQLVVIELPSIDFELVEYLDTSDRDVKGFGSTG